MATGDTERGRGRGRGLVEPGDDEMCEIRDFAQELSAAALIVLGSEAVLVACTARPLHHCDQCQRQVCTTHWCQEAAVCVDCQLIWVLGLEEERIGRLRG